MSKADVSRDPGLSFFNPLGTKPECAWRKKSASTAVSGCAGGNSFSGQDLRQKNKLPVQLSYLRFCFTSFSSFWSLAMSFSFYSSSFSLEVSWVLGGNIVIKDIANSFLDESVIKCTAKKAGKKYTILPYIFSCAAHHELAFFLCLAC